MKIGLRILLGYFLIVGLAAWFLLNVFVQQVKPGVRSTQEDTLVDTAQMLAILVADDVKAGTMDQSRIGQGIRTALKRRVDLKIEGYDKGSLSNRVYVTDARGIVLFDSRGTDVGKDYSRWNDVYKTLRGTYGARSTAERPDDENSTVMHVAAPIRDGEKIIGVLTIAKPNANVQPFVERSQRVILERGALLLVLSLLIGGAFAWWLSQSLRSLMVYINDVEQGKKAALPALGNNEIGTLGRALESMRNRLEGKEYVEELMHTMAHELKSPIAAIQGAAELLQEDMPEAERKHFLANILHQNARQRQLIDKLLALIKVEKQQHLLSTESVKLRELVAQLKDDCEIRLASRRIQFDVEVDDISVRGDPLLLRQALGNLVDNAIDFSPAGSVIALRAMRQDTRVLISVTDAGSGIPAFAHERLFERFYSLPRPDGARSTGLGLPFVREVAALHGGSISVENGADKGVIAILALPML
ncbi:MAG: two-component system sensor histidine kinase CreC [Pseudomonadota bacterium]